MEDEINYQLEEVLNKYSDPYIDSQIEAEEDSIHCSDDYYPNSPY